MARVSVSLERFPAPKEKGSWHFVLFLGNGKSIEGKGFKLEANERTNAVLEYKNNEYYFSSEGPLTITLGNKKIEMNKTAYKKIKL